MHSEALSSYREIRIRDRDFNALCSLVHEVAGIKLTEAKSELVRARLSKRMRFLNIYDLGDYLRYVEEDQTQDELITMLDSLSTNLTSFFREKTHFDFVKDTILPGIVERASKGGDASVRVWSAGCSTGEEPYTLALCLLEHLPNPNRFDPRILASDISTRVLEIAQNGIYHEDRVRAIPSVLLHRYFVKVGEKGRKFYGITDEVKRLVRYRRLNLMEKWPMKRQFDFIFCRNTMIYFDKPTQNRLVNRFYEQLKSGGYLILGHSESLTGTTHQFQYIKPTIYRKA
ncbi:protein-glutamate O-methyltransferase [bacterium]|nr:protein-glutamate O-methyltransferase [bacterium]MBU1937218.1 protein-glutamate O-methyltransferase [bacterium]